MTTYRHKHYCELLSGSMSLELELTLAYNVQPGAKDEPPSYSSGGSPGSSAYVEDLQCLNVRSTTFGHAIRLDDWTIEWLLESIDHADLLDSAKDADDYARQEATDYADHD